MKTLLLSLILIGIALPSLFGQANSSPILVSPTVTVDSIQSTILNRKVPTTIILPPNYDAAKSYPVFYLLHWWSGNNESFLKTNLVTELKDRQLIVVTPSADTCWYVNSAANRYEDFMTLELFDYIDKKYRTNSTRQAIGGFSMGAFGALQIGLKHTGRFTFIADMSGPINAPFYDVPLKPKSPLPFIMNSVRTSFGEANSPVATGSNVFRLVKSVPASTPVFIYMAVGKQDEFDFITPQHKLFIEALKKQKIKYQYQEFDGNHFNGKVLNASLPSLLTKLTDTLKQKD